MPRFMIDSPAVLQAIETASARMGKNPKSPLERLPNEVKLMIAASIPDNRSIFNLALSGPDFCSLIVKHEKWIAKNVISWYIPAEIMHLAVAAHMASTTTFNIRNGGNFTQDQQLSVPYVDSTVQFVEKFRRHEDLTLEEYHPRGLALSELDRYLKMHHAVRYYARQLSMHALQLVPDYFGFGSKVTSSVLFRYMRTLYIMELVTELFSWRGAPPVPQPMILAWGMFWFSFYPWEIEQVFCVQKLLERRIFTLIFGPNAIPNNPNNERAMSCYIVYQGPARLCALETSRPNRLALNFQHFLRYRSPELITMGYAAPGFGMRSILPKLGARISSSTHHHLDVGPMRMWFYVALRGECGARYPRRVPGLFFDMRSLVYAGYALWDDIKVDWLKMPELETMHQTMVNEIAGSAQHPPNPSQPIRVVPLTFRSIESRSVDGHRSAPGHTHARNEYVFLAMAETLAEVGEAARTVPDVGHGCYA